MEHMENNYTKKKKGKEGGLGKMGIIGRTKVTEGQTYLYLRQVTVE